MTRTKAADRAGTRFIWDELLSYPVARALRELGFSVTHVGHEGDGAPDRGASDADVIDFAQARNQVIVTFNHDMMLLCDERGQRFVWLDPRGRQFRQEEQVVLCFQQIRRWQEILETGACVHAMRTKAEPITSADAARLAHQRFKALRRRQRTGRRRSTPGQPELATLEHVPTQTSAAKSVD